MASKAEFIYLDGRGLGETVRMLLCLAKIPYEEKTLKTREEFLKLKDDGELLFNQLPLLKIDGLKLVQSRAIMRYLANKAGMSGKDAEERVRIDMVAEGAFDFCANFVRIGWLNQTEQEILDEIKTVSCPKYLPLFNKILEENQTGYTVGPSASYADVYLFHGTLYITEYLGDAVFADYPALKKFHEKMNSLPEMQHYVKNVRKRKNDELYIKEAKTVLGFK